MKNDLNDLNEKNKINSDNDIDISKEDRFYIEKFKKRLKEKGFPELPELSDMTSTKVDILKEYISNNKRINKLPNKTTIREIDIEDYEDDIGLDAVSDTFKRIKRELEIDNRPNSELETVVSAVKQQENNEFHKDSNIWHTIDDIQKVDLKKSLNSLEENDPTKPKGEIYKRSVKTNNGLKRP